MLLNYAVGEDSWQSLGQQGDQTSQSWRKPTLNIHWKDWCWSWNSNTLASWCKEPTHDAGKGWGQEEKGTREDEIIGWHHQFNGHEFEQTQGDSKGQRSLACGHNWTTATNTIIQNIFTGLKIPCASSLPLSILTTPGNHKSFYFPHSFALSRTSYSWNHTVRSLFRLTSFTP